MLASAFLTIAAVTEHARHPAPSGQIPLTRNEIARLFTYLIIQPARTPGTCSTGLNGGAATNTAHERATTSGKARRYEHNDLLLEY
jgi:hypothetical protein